MSSGLPFARVLIASLPLLCALPLACGEEVEPSGTPTGGTSTGVQPAVLWMADPITQTAPYQAGDGVRVEQANGEVTMEPGAGSEVSVTFEPFTMRADDEEALAASEMADDLLLTVEDQGTTVLIRVAKADGASAYLGAHVTVSLPATFSGGLAVDSHNGGLDLSAASGQLTIDTDNGSCRVAVAAWSPLDGSVHVGNGDLSFTVAVGLEGAITAFADGSGATVVSPSPLPADWQVEELSTNEKNYLFGANPSAGGTVALDTGSGDIELYVE